jgi:hypothetical protein
MSEVNELKQVIFDSKKRISANMQKVISYMFLLLFAFFCVFFAYSYFFILKNIVFLICGLVSLLIVLLVIKSLKGYRRVYADEDFIYIKYKGEEEKVSYKQIYLIKLPMFTFIRDSRTIRIYYKAENGEEKRIKFLPIRFTSNFNKFVDVISMKNPEVTLKKDIF